MCRLLFVLVALAPIGCAALVANTGIKPDSLTREKIDEIGTAVSNSTDDKSVTFRTHHKIAEPERSKTIIGRDVDTWFGSAELVEFPYELYRTARTTILGREVQVWYGGYEFLGSDQAAVESVQIDGDRVYDQPQEYRRHWPSYHRQTRESPNNTSSAGPVQPPAAD